MKVQEESEKFVLKLNIQKTKIMESNPISSWQIDGETVETVADFVFWGSKAEKAMAPHSSTLPGKSHGWRSLVGSSQWGR